MLRVASLSAGYGDLMAVRDVSVTICEGEFVGIVGSNAAGKSTLIRAIIGLLPRRTGDIYFDGEPVTEQAPYRLAQRGMAAVLEHSVLSKMSVLDNLMLGAYRSRARAGLKGSLERAFDMFPILFERKSQAAGQLSGGEQQMLCVARALMSQPKMIVLDEPSVGLSPLMVSTILNALRELHRSGLTILLVEQNVIQTLKYVSRAYVMEGGGIRLEGPAAELLGNEEVRVAYLGL